MHFIRTSVLTGATSAMEVDVTDSELREWEGGVLIQKALPRASQIQREFLISGMSALEQENFFDNDGDD